MMLSGSLFKLTPTLTDNQHRRLRRLFEGISLWLAVLLMLFVHPLYAEARQDGTESAGLLRFVDDGGRWQEPAIILDSEFDVRVNGLIAESRLSRRFRNASDRWREGVFVFPLPDNASVYGLTMKVGERTIVGKVRPRAEARKTYETAKASGRHAASVEQQRSNLFTARVANIPPGKTIAVELRFQQPVDYRSGVFELRLPTTLMPRYIPGKPITEQPQEWQGGWAVPTDEVPDAGAISPYTVRAGDVSDISHRASIRMAIDAGLPLARVFSPTHRLETRLDGQKVEVQPEGGKMLMNRDFVVRWQPMAGQEPTAAVFHQRWHEKDYLMAMVVPGKASGRVLPRELVFVIDTSGSMAGESIRQARSALQRGLNTLRPNDRFNVIRFNSQTHALFMQPEMANGNNLARARGYVDRLHADGGTEMAPALAMALQTQESQSEKPAGLVRQVVFITDGAVGNEAALFDQIRQQLGDRRLFTVGIGSAPNMHFMREAARWGRGVYTSIQDASDVSGPLEALFSAMEAPVLTDIQVQWPSPAESGGGAVNSTESLPARPGDLFQGAPLVQVTQGVAPAGLLKVSGKLPGGKIWERSLDLQQAASASGLHRHWAREKIDSLLDEAKTSGQEPDKPFITALATGHGLMSPYTSFVAVDATPARPISEPLATDSLPTLLPAGSASSMLRYPQTATIAPLLTALGLTGLMFAVAIGLLQRRTTA
ncbi:marine proteobacterial sortase target protein [Marinobacter salinus]|uniref:Marine proteobacterial sortase target protein n=1 Tax=Marinobacter salinus TaxID=1874317 RepID=A0A1D9GPS9_9GAMM|nr:marine proteobacterial sortase target protein [Marinobacter salinus]AOY89643.1 marine proteobacterial sortase target protein [Marinobacter salinus]